MKPILFNTDMVRAILDGRKTVTRRVVKQGKSTPKYHNRDKFYGVVDHLNNDYKNWYAGFYNDNDIFYGANGERLIDAIYFKAPYKVNDILYVRETWCDDRQYTKDDTAGIYFYKANEKNSYNVKWRPSIHMPKEAARLFLRVTDVRVEKLRDMKLEDFLKEGIYIKRSEAVPTGSNNMLTGSERQAAIDCRREAVAREKFKDLWNSTAGKPFSPERYANSWYGNPYVWVIEFEVIPADQAEGN